MRAGCRRDLVLGAWEGELLTKKRPLKTQVLGSDIVDWDKRKDMIIDWRRIHGK